MKKRRLWTRVTAGLLAGASACALYQVVATAQATWQVEAAIARIPGLHVGSVSVDPWSGRIVLAGLGGGGHHMRFSAGRIEFRGRPSALPQFVAPAFAAGTASAENIEIDFGNGKVRIPKVEASGTDLSNGDLAAIFDAKSATPLTERVARLSADQITMPKIAIDVASPGMTQSIAYNDVKLDRVVKGKIGEYSAGVSTLSATMGGPQGDVGPIEGTFGAASAKNVDVALYARLLTESRKDPDEALAPLYDSSVIDGIDVKGRGFSLKVGKLTGGNVKVRPFTTSIFDFQKLMPTTPGAKPSPEQTKKSLQFVADIYDSMDLGTAQATDLVVNFGTGTKAGTVKVARFGFAQFAKARIGEIAVDGFELTGPRVLVKFDTFAMRGFDLRPLITAMKTAPLDDPVKMSVVNPRTFIPSLDQIAFSGIDFVAPDKRGRGNADGGASYKFKLGKIDLTASNYLLGIPASLALTVEHLALDLPPPRDANARQLADMGYTAVDLTSKFAYVWNESANTLTVKEASLQGEGMGSIALSSVLGNVTKDLFVGDTAVMQAAALGTAIAEVDMRLVNGGFITRLLDTQAKRAGVTLDQLRQELIKSTRQGIAQLFGDSTQATTLADAATAFLQDPKSLEIVVKSAKGLGAADLPLLQNPAELLKRLDVQATANR